MAVYLTSGTAFSELLLLQPRFSGEPPKGGELKTKENTMKRFTLTAAAALFATSAIASTEVQSVEVEADLTAIENSAAASVWKDLSADLETEIAERLVSKIGEDGASIEIEIDSVELANSFSQAVGVADSKLVGDVEIDAPGLFNKIDYTLTVSGEQAVAYYPDGTEMADLTVGSEVYYNAMLDAFADNVVSKLDD